MILWKFGIFRHVKTSWHMVLCYWNKRLSKHLGTWCQDKTTAHSGWILAFLQQPSEIFPRIENSVGEFRRITETRSLLLLSEDFQKLFTIKEVYNATLDHIHGYDYGLSRDPHQRSIRSLDKWVYQEFCPSLGNCDPGQSIKM